MLTFDITTAGDVEWLDGEWECEVRCGRDNVCQDENIANGASRVAPKGGGCRCT